MDVEGLPFGDKLARALPYLATAAIVIGFINFFWVIGESMSIGDAAQGRIVEGHYFLGNKGRYTEVSEAVWTWSQIHGISIFITHPFAMAGMFYVTLRRAFPAKMAGSVAMDSDMARKRLDLVRSSGPALAEGTMGGRVGPISMTAPLLKVWVHPNGLILRAMLGAEHAILAAEILRVGPRRVFLQSGVEVSHLGMGSKSPLVLYRPLDDPLVTAIRQVLAEDATRSTPPIIERLPLVENPDNPTEGAGDAALGLRRWEVASAATVGEPAIPGLPPGLSTVLEVLGLSVSVVLVVIGVLWAIPRLGLPGLIWTAVAVAILAWNGTKFVRRHTNR